MKSLYQNKHPVGHSDHKQPSSPYQLAPLGPQTGIRVGGVPLVAAPARFLVSPCTAQLGLWVGSKDKAAAAAGFMESSEWRSNMTPV